MRLSSLGGIVRYESKEVVPVANLELRDTSHVTRAFLLINVVAGKEDSVASGSLKLEQVREAHVVPVDYDPVAVIEADRGPIKPVTD